jgi:hypothetical protein
MWEGSQQRFVASLMRCATPGKAATSITIPLPLPLARKFAPKPLTALVGSNRSRKGELLERNR